MKKILIVGSDLKDTQKLGNCIKSNFEVYSSYLEEGALGLCLAKNFDLIIINYSLKDARCITLIKKVKEVQPDIKIILISGCKIPDEGKIRRLGIDAFIGKPFKMNFLKEIIDLILG
ncbi:response regulator [candidate division WOR-3 bacterium]|nr:response regulator [candidate division WOR-3 bacterium]